MLTNHMPKNILVVEDNPGDYLLIEDYLTDKFEHLTVTHARDFKTAKNLLIKNNVPYDIILLDLDLPDSSGDKLIANISGLANDAIIIILSGYSNLEFSIKSLSMGVSDYLIKDDINATSLHKSIVYNVERKRTNQRLAESEKRFSNLFHMSPQPMWVYDLTTLAFILVNEAAIAKYGYSHEEFLGMTIMDIRPEEEVTRLQNLLNTRKVDESQSGGHFRHRLKSGETIQVEIYSSPINIDNKLYRSVIAIDVTEKVLFEQKMTRAIIKTQEEERYEIGSELHDNVCQLLATSQMLMGMVKNGLDPSAVKPYEQSVHCIGLALEDIRNLSHRLAPAFFKDATMEDTFRMLINNAKVGSSFDIILHIDNAINSYALGNDIQLNLYRVLQEQLRNITKHAQASSVKIEISVHKQNLRMKIADDGVGFNTHEVKGGIGLANMKRRAELFCGHLQISSSPGKGCKLLIEIPINDSDIKTKKLAV